MVAITTRKKVLFSAALFVIPFAVLAFLELVLRLCSYGDDLSLFVRAPDGKRYEINRLVGERFFNRYQHTTPIADSFLKSKPADGYRIFVLGESTVQGFPYDANLAFSRILQRRLQDIFPGRSIEVVNLGLTAVNSYTLLDFADDLLEQKPDLVLIYTGHNEYYGALGVGSTENGSIPRWLKKMHLKLIHLRMYQLLQDGIAHIYKLTHPMTAGEARATLMENMVGRNLVPYHSEMYWDGLSQFDSNMAELLGKMKKDHVPVIISDLVSNVRDLTPFRSAPYETYPRADSVYANAQNLEARGLFEEARVAYAWAKDLDIIRFRAPEDLNKRIARLADSPGVYALSLKSLFEQHSRHGLVGNNLMADHLHPNVDGYFLMADGFLSAMREYGMIAKDWDSVRIQPSAYYRNDWGFTELDSMIAAIRIQHLKAGWPFQPEATVNTFRTTYVPHGVVDSLAFLSVTHFEITSSMVHKKLAAYYESIGEFGRAAKEYLSLAYATPSDVSSYYYAADLAHKAGESAGAIRYLRESPHSDTSAYVQFTLASNYAEQKNNREALLSLDKLEKCPPDNKIALPALALKYRIQRDSGLSAGAGNTLKDIRKLDPSFSESARGKSMMILIPNRLRPYIDKAEGLRKIGRFPEALAVLKEANGVQEIPYTNLLMGKILFLEKDLEALKYLEKARVEFKDDPSLEYSLCILYLIKRDIPKARAALDSFVRLQEGVNAQSRQLEKLLEKTMTERNQKNSVN